MITDRTYLVAGSLAHRLNEALPELATVLEADLDPIRKGVHVHVQVNKVMTVGTHLASLSPLPIT